MVKRYVLAVVVVLALLLAPVSMMALAPADAEAAISHALWLNTAYRGTDPLLGSVQAYEAGSTATLQVLVLNNAGSAVTLKGAKVKFDWAGGEYAAAAGSYPSALAEGETGTISISFTVPGENATSHLVPHGYTVSVEYQWLGGLVLSWSLSGSDFAVYSADQNAAMDARQKMAAIGTPALNTTGSRELAAKSALERQMGEQAYAAGRLPEARERYEQAYDYLDRAIKGDKDPNTLKEVEPAGRLLLGIGMVLLAFGVILYAWRRPAAR